MIEKLALVITGVWSTFLLISIFWFYHSKTSKAASIRRDAHYLFLLHLLAASLFGVLAIAMWAGA